MKPNQGYIDGILGEENVGGREHIIVHWEGFLPGDDTSSMSKTYAKKFPVLREMLNDYERAKLLPVKEMPAKESGKDVVSPQPSEKQDVEGAANTLKKGVAVALAKFLGNYRGGGMKQTLAPHNNAC
jgi:hypothetical protein